MSMINPITVEGFPQYARPWNNITPFTYRDGLTYLEVLEALRAYVKDTLVPAINAEMAEVGGAWNDEVLALVSAVEGALNEQASNVNAALATQASEATAKIDAWVSGQVSINDEVVSTLVNQANSLAQGAINSLIDSGIDNRAPYATARGADHVAAQAALNAGAGGVVVFKPGDYYFTEAVYVPEGTTVMGNGAVIHMLEVGAWKSAFIIDVGVSNVTIDGFTFIGNWADTDNTTYNQGGNLADWSENMAYHSAIQIRGRMYQRTFSGLSAAQMSALTDIHENITIRNVTINGFGDMGILADQVNNFKVLDSTIEYCGHAGVFMMGVVNGQITGNSIGHLFPGYSDGDAPMYNMYGVAATRVYGSPTYPDLGLLIGRPSSDITMANNHVYDCPTWKGLDTHGGKRITFEANLIEDCYIGIGIDMGGSNNSYSGDVAPENIVVSNNTLRHTADGFGTLAGVTAYGNREDAQLNAVTIVGNQFINWGGGGGASNSPVDGAISLSNVRNAIVSGNIMRDPALCGVRMRGRIDHATITGNVFDSPRHYFTAVVNNGGSGYASSPTVMASGGGGYGWRGYAKVANGVVTGIKQIHPGYGYTSAPALSFSGGGGTGAAATMTLQPGAALLTVDTVGAVLSDNTFINGNSVTAGVNFAAGFGIQVGENRYINSAKPNPAIRFSGDEFMRPKAWGRISNTGVISGGFGIKSVTKTGIGTYDVEINEPISSTAAGIAMASTLSNYTGRASASFTTTSVVAVTTYNSADTLADSTFQIVVYGY